MRQNTFLIIDFDSTFVTVESLDELAKIVLSERSDKEEIIQKIEKLTRLGMDGEISFAESLEKRVSLFFPTKEHIGLLITSLNTRITPSIIKNKEFFRKYADQIYIISGGFKDFIIPVVEPFGISSDHVLANAFFFDHQGKIIGYDKQNLLSQTQGKVRQVQALGLSGEIIVVGDGYTDFEIRENKAANQFLAFSENVRRENVVAKADNEVMSFDEVIKYV